MNDFQKARAEQLLQSFSTPEETLQKSDIAHLDYLEKGGTRAQIGEIRLFGGRNYIKTTTGWKFHGLGSGARAKEHRVAANGHNRAEAGQTQATPTPPAAEPTAEASESATTRTPAVPTTFHSSVDNMPQATLKELIKPYLKGKDIKAISVVANPNANDYFNNNATITIRDVDGETVHNVQVSQWKDNGVATKPWKLNTEATATFTKNKNGETVRINGQLHTKGNKILSKVKESLFTSAQITELTNHLKEAVLQSNIVDRHSHDEIKFNKNLLAVYNHNEAGYSQASNRSLGEGICLNIGGETQANSSNQITNKKFELTINKNTKIAKVYVGLYTGNTYSSWAKNTVSFKLNNVTDIAEITRKYTKAMKDAFAPLLQSRQRAGASFAAHYRNTNNSSGTM